MPQVFHGISQNTTQPQMSNENVELTAFLSFFIWPCVVSTYTYSTWYSTKNSRRPLGRCLELFLWVALYSAPANSSHFSLPKFWYISSTQTGVFCLDSSSQHYHPERILRQKAGIFMKITLFPLSQRSQLCTACCPTSEHNCFLYFIQFSNCL